MNNPLIEVFENWQGGIKCQYSNTKYSAKETKELVEQLVKRLKVSELQSGAVVGVALANTICFPSVFMALIKIGCHPVLIHNAVTQNELDVIKEKYNLNWFVHDFLPGCSQLSLQKKSYSFCLSINTMEIDVIRFCRDRNPLTRLGIENSVILHATSGTYGRAQYCIRNQKVALTEAENYIKTIDIYQRCTIRITTPLSHAYAYGFGLIATLLSDSTLVMDAQFNPKKILREESKRLSDIIAVVPPMIDLFADMKIIGESVTLPKYVFYAGAKCKKESIAKFETNTGNTVYAIYGTTETGGISTNYSKDNKLKGVGRSLSNVHLEIKRKGYSDIGDKVGDVYVRSSSMMQGYYDGTDLIKCTLPFSTGDLGYIEKNDLELVGREKDIINVGGYKVDPNEIETILKQFPGVKDVVVYPGKVGNTSEIVQSVIVSEGIRLNIDELKKHCALKLSSYKQPTNYYFSDKIPRTASGKCMKIELPNYAKLV